MGAAVRRATRPRRGAALEKTVNAARYADVTGTCFPDGDFVMELSQNLRASVARREHVSKEKGTA
jgi:hypothetical protein